VFCVPYVRGPRECECSYGPGTFPGRQNCRVSINRSWLNAAHVYRRSTPSEPFLAKSTSVQQSCSSADSRAASLQSQCASSFPNSARSSIQQSCWIAKQAGAKVLGLSHSKIRMCSLSLGLGILRLTANWYVVRVVSCIQMPERILFTRVD
jgi:hypothetical protein